MSAPALLPDAAAELARQGATDALATTLRQGLDVDLRDAKGNTLLMIAAYQGRAETVAMLLKAGAQVDLRNEKGQTPLGGVAFKGHLDIARMLLDAGADPLGDQGGSTPMDFATTFGRQEIITLLREHRPAAKPTRWYSRLIGWIRGKR
jgi:ankyrin repeat protein